MPRQIFLCMFVGPVLSLLSPLRAEGEEAAVDLESIRGSIALSDGRHMLGGGIKVVVTIRNDGKEAIRLPMRLDVDSTATDAGGRAVPRRETHGYGDGGGPIGTLQPGQEHRYADYLADQLAFEAPGDYRVECSGTFPILDAKVFSRHSTLTVRDAFRLRLLPKDEKALRKKAEALSRQALSGKGKKAVEAARALCAMDINVAGDFAAATLASSDPRVQYHAARALAFSKSARHRTALCKAAEDPTIRHRSTIVSWLGYGRVREAMPVLKRLLFSDESPHVRWCALTAIGNMGATEDLEESIRAVAGRDKSQRVRSEAESMLRRLARKRAGVSVLRGRLEEMVASEHPNMRRGAVQLLEVARGKGSGEDMTDLVRKLAQDEDPEVRAEAAKLLDKVGEEREEEPGRR